MAGIEGEPRRGEPTQQQRRPTEQLKPQMEAGNSAPGIPPTLNERAKPPPEKSALSRAVERTRDLYERNGWAFLPLGEAGQGNVSSADTGDAELPEAGLNDNAPRKLRRWRSSSVGGGRLHLRYQNERDKEWGSNPRKSSPPPPDDQLR
jgi:hypothetical protein